MKTTQRQYTVITGASSGIGRATAKAFARRGEHLVITGRRTGNLERLKAEIQGDFPSLDIIVKTGDLSIFDHAYQLYEELKPYHIKTWINNAGFGYYGETAKQDVHKIETMIRLNVEALTILSCLYVQDYKDTPGAQLINIASAGGYAIVPHATAYCATKFFVSTFTEGLARELKESNAALQAKVLAPSATKTEFGKVANNMDDYDYDKAFGTYHTSKQMADFLLDLYDSSETVGIVNRETYAFHLTPPQFAYTGNSAHNQKA